MTDKFILLIHENFTDTFTLYKHCDDEHSFQSNTVYSSSGHQLKWCTAFAAIIRTSKHFWLLQFI